MTEVSSLPGVNVQIKERFYKYVNKTEDCWIWIAAKDRNGYGRFWFSEQMRLAHHIAWLLEDKRPTSYLRHKCNNPSCVNPTHLLEGTHADNMKDIALSGTHGNRKVDPTEAIHLRRKGWTLTQIGDRYGASKQAVRAAIIRHTQYGN